MSRKPPEQPRADASQLYRRQQTSSPASSQRDIEAQALLKAARKLNEVALSWSNDHTIPVPTDLEDALKFNRQVWVVFHDSASGVQPTQGTLKTNVVTLANFVFRKSLDIIADPERAKLDILININREVAAGLMARSE